jgi:hypothetical protein
VLGSSIDQDLRRGRCPQLIDRPREARDGCGVLCVGGVAYVVGGVITSSLRSDSDGWIDTYVSDRDGLDRACSPGKVGNDMSLRDRFSPSSSPAVWLPSYSWWQLLFGGIGSSG